MKRDNKLLYIYEVIILLYILLYRFIVIRHYISYTNYTNIVFLILLGISLYLIGGFPRDTHYFKKTSIRIVIIILLVYFLISNLLGLFVGFYEPAYTHKLFGIIKNVLPVSIYILILEIDRYLLIRRGTNKFHFIVLTVLFILFNLNISLRDIPTLENAENLFLMFSLVILPIISRELLFMYMTKNVSYVPSLIYHLLMDTYSMIIPFMPDLGNYLSSVFMVFLPYVTYKQIKKGLNYREKYRYYGQKLLVKVLSLILLVFFGVLVILVSGIFKYKMIGIASDSMNPVYYRGDAVIYKKVLPSEVTEGEILAFQVDNILVTHRVIKIIHDENGYLFVTKGDNNEEVDNFEVRDKNVVGIVKYVVKYIAFPTVWFNDYTEEVN